MNPWMTIIPEACGIFGVYGHPEAAKMCYFGLYALQHRGQESAGISAVDNGVLSEHRAMGLVSDVFSMDQLEGLKGSSAIGHVRYSTTGSSVLAHALAVRGAPPLQSLCRGPQRQHRQRCPAQPNWKSADRSFSPPWTAKSLCI